MKEALKKIVRISFPKSFLKRIALIIKNDESNILRKNIIKYYRKLPKKNVTEEQYQVIKYLKKNYLSVFPYSFHEKKNRINVDVYFDEKLTLHYTLLEGKKLYFKKCWTIDNIKSYYGYFMAEQDIDSPHRYLTNDFCVRDNDIVFDIGAAEGNFALSIVEKVRKIYLFETDSEWIEALHATFAPYENVEIINKFISDRNDQNKISIDCFIATKKEVVSFLKIDVDGEEANVLRGCEKTLTFQKPLKVALCTYHNQNDEVIFSKLLRSKGFEIVYSKGYMIFSYDKNIKPPYLRRGMIRAMKK